MTLKRIMTVIAFAAALGLAFGLQNSSQHKVLFEKAKFTMETKGDLKGAIGLFEEIIKRYPNERDYAAKALYLIGTCYEKLGEKQAQQAQAAFQKIVEDYPDQTEAVSLAKEKLLGLQKAQVPAVAGEGEFRIRKSFKVGSFAAPSLDGKFISYRDEAGNLAIIDTATGKKQILTDNASWEKGDFVSTSIISLDNKQVAYAWCENYVDLTLKIVNHDGSGVRVLHSGKMEPREKSEYFWPYDWTPDGQRILGILNKGKANQIGFVSTKNGSFRHVGGVDEIDMLPLLQGGYLDLSSDGRWIAYARLQDEISRKSDIVILAADGSRETSVFKHPANDRLLGWTPGGDSVLFASDRSGSWDAWIVPVKEGKAQGEPILVKRDFGQVGGPTGVSPLGFTQNGSFYYTVQSLTEDVYITTLNTDKPEILDPPEKVSQQFEGSNSYADWSPDGKYLAFSSQRGPNSSALSLVSLETGEQRDIYPSELVGFIRVNWHPDGKSLIVVRGGIHRIEIESGTVSPVVTEGQGFHSPRCTPDGRFVFYENDSFRDNIYKIMRVDLKTKEKKEMYRSTGQIIRMDISRDGKRLAFLESADSTLKVMPIEGGEPRVLYRFREGWATSVAWSPDGKYLFYAKIPEGAGKMGKIELWRIPSKGGEPVKLPLVAKGMENLRIHPDGKRISFNTVAFDRETYVMENFLPKK